MELPTLTATVRVTVAATVLLALAATTPAAAAGVADDGLSTTALGADAGPVVADYEEVCETNTYYQYEGSSPNGVPHYSVHVSTTCYWVYK
jgi:hypothetical protein